jgi:hypothetical protein
MTNEDQFGKIVLIVPFDGRCYRGGLYEQIVLTPLWSGSPPSSFSIIQPVLLALFLTWRQIKVRYRLLIGLGSYMAMRVWSALFFIPEMLAFQKCLLIPLHPQSYQ